VTDDDDLLTKSNDLTYGRAVVSYLKTQPDWLVLDRQNAGEIAINLDKVTAVRPDGPDVFVHYGRSGIARFEGTLAERLKSAIGARAVNVRAAAAPAAR
jgi:hypothetical protein